MQTNTWFVHDEKRIDQRRPQARGQIHTLHFTAAQRARRTIERQISDSNVAEIVQSRANLVAQHCRRGVVRRDFDPGKKIAGLGNGERGELRQGQL